MDTLTLSMSNISCMCVCVCEFRMKRNKKKGNICHSNVKNIEKINKQEKKSIGNDIVECMTTEGRIQ